MIKTNLVNLYWFLFPIMDIFCQLDSVGAIVYHTLGGIRHHVWDFKPNLMTNSIAHFSSIGLAVSSIGITTAYMHLKTSKLRIK